MEVQKISPTHFIQGNHMQVKNNVILFPRLREKKENSIVTEQTVDILICSLCQSTTFFLLLDGKGKIACSQCGYTTGNTWTEEQSL